MEKRSTLNHKTQDLISNESLKECLAEEAEEVKRALGFRKMNTLRAACLLSVSHPLTELSFL